jgi:hypothetical protein
MVESKDAGSCRGRCVDVEGDPLLIEELSECIREALVGRQAYYHVRVDGVGRCGEVVVRITGNKGRLPLLFERGDLTPGYVRSVVQATVDKFAF